jgi:hypothetical protein
MKISNWSVDEIQRDFKNCLSLNDIIEGIQDRLRESGEVLCEVRINGMALTETDEDRFAESPLSEIRELAVKSSEVPNLIRDAQSSILDYLNEMMRVSLKVSEHFRDGRMEEAHAAFHALIDAAHWLMEMIEQFNKTNPVSEADAEAQLLAVSQELLSVYQKKDYVLVADILEYDWTSTLEVWLSLIRNADITRNSEV